MPMHFKTVLFLFFITASVQAQNISWDKAYGNTSGAVLRSDSEKKIHQISPDSILSSIGNKQIIIIGDQRHSVWEGFAIKNYIVQNLCSKEKINYLNEGSIYQFYYKNCKKIYAQGLKIGPFDFQDVYFGKTLGNDLLDSLALQGTMDSITFWGIDYQTRNIKELVFLYDDLIIDINANKEIEIGNKIDTGFVKEMIEIEIVNHEAIDDFKYNDSIKNNINFIGLFYDKLIAKKNVSENKFKKRMWRCVSQSVQYYLAQKEMNVDKAQNFEMEEMTKFGWVLRDKFLYENIKWFLNEILDTTKRAIISIATIHAIKSMEFDDKWSKINPEYRSAGMLLNFDKSFRNKIYVISIMPISGYHGMFSNYLSKIPAFPKKSYENELIKSSENIFFQDLSKSPNEFYMQPFPGKFLTKQRWDQFFDAVFFVKNVIPNGF